MAAVVKALKLVAKGIKAARAAKPTKVLRGRGGSVRIVKGAKLASRKKKEIQKNDGQGNIQVFRKIGSQPKKLSSTLEAKIRDVLNPANHHVIQQTGNVHITPGKCVYTSFEMMNCEDVDEVIDGISRPQPSPL